MSQNVVLSPKNITLKTSNNSLGVSAGASTSAKTDNEVITLLTQLQSVNLTLDRFYNGWPFLTSALSACDNTHYYFGGIKSNGDWKINRLTRSDNLAAGNAQESNNPTYANLSAAFSNRTTLTYG